MFSIVMRTAGGESLEFFLIVGTAIDVSGDYLVTFGDLLLDADVEIGRSGYLFNYRSLVVLCVTLFPCKRVMNYEVGSQEFIHGGHVALTLDLLEEFTHQGFIIHFDRQKLPPRYANSPSSTGPTLCMMPARAIRRIAVGLLTERRGRWHPRRIRNCDSA
jgi:hypothetical protein